MNVLVTRDDDGYMRVWEPDSQITKRNSIWITEGMIWEDLIATEQSSDRNRIKDMFGPGKFGVRKGCRKLLNLQLIIPKCRTCGRQPKLYGVKEQFIACICGMRTIALENHNKDMVVQ